MSEVPGVIHELVERFERNRDQYRGPAYNEAQTRIEFIDPFFEALGWDMANKAGHAEDYKDVIHEAAVRVGGVTKAPDYCFRIGQTPKFFLEAKSPATRIGLDQRPAYQLRRYAWSAKLPLAVLTNFDEFAVYDGRFGPQESDKASDARIMYVKYSEYPGRWPEIAEVFAKESILRGSFDRYAASEKGKRGTAPVDVRFLEDIEQWRESLAHNIALRNPGLSVEQLNFAVQKTIDRIIFLRMCEDRGIEQYGQLQGLCSGHNTYARLCRIYLDADDRYNSGLFHFALEKGRAEGPDDLTLSLSIDEKVLKDIIRRLYFPKSPYEFRVIPADILGNVYEQFLGKVIVVKSPTRADVEAKPEVKKAGGVYYTPGYIVDYIVKNTVGKLCEGKTPRRVAKLCILDPACGSGSFLIGAYTCLLDWHRDWYVGDGPEKHKKEIYQGPGGRWLLTTAEKKRILLSNIHGVDIDSQAVEVTKLNLLLKVLEGETRETLHLYMSPMRERTRALPDLGGNIKCGNSLIGSDFFADRAADEIDPDECKRINPFDWESEFPEIMKSGGFDAVIGNPPWGSFFSSVEKKYLWSKFANRRGEAESHLFFMERAVQVMKAHGGMGFITPNTWLSVVNSRELREFLLGAAGFTEICELSKYVFRSAPDIVPILVFLTKEDEPSEGCLVRRPETARVRPGRLEDGFVSDHIPQSVWRATPGCVINLRATTVALRIAEQCRVGSTRLSDVAEVLYGIKTGNNRKYLSNTPTDTHTAKALKTGEVARYSLTWKGIALNWCRDLAGYRASPVEVPKIVIQYIRKLSLPRRIVAAFDGRGEYYPLNNYSYVVSVGGRYPLEYLLGLLNSRLLNFYFANTFVDYNIKPTYLQQLPIRTTSFDDPAEKARHDKMVKLVEWMLALHEGLAAANIPDEKTRIQRRIEATDREIDALVYELYGLTEEEIKIVEGVE